MKITLVGFNVLCLIREVARKQGISTIPCSTIHKAQGQEYHTVILDVINLSGKNRFLSETLSKELINVAFSRAKARLIVLANEKDLNSKYIKALQPTLVLSAPLLKAEPNVCLPYLADYAPIGEHNVEAIRNQLFNLLLPSGDYIQVKPLAIQDQYLKVEKHPEGQPASYRLTMINS